MAPLSPDLRKSLDKAVVAARDEAESACEAALRALGVPADQAPPGINDEQRALRNALRAKQRQVGGAFEQLISECAYEQWHLMLFARFLAENGLLRHPGGASVTLSDVAELAREEGESDPWLLAARYAAAMLPGIFKTADPCVRLPLAPEGRKALEDILEALPSEVFTSDDALGWVYQFWQTKKKKEVNASERKIGGADLAPVTQLFTEHYMVRFLLENSLGAWWAAHQPESPLLTEWEYLRFGDDRSPAAGRFEGWPDTAAEVTVMDPCCGSGHFLIAAFEMLRKMREEEDGLSTREATDAVLSDNLYGLELDPRCIQLAAFALALAAWKVSGYHELPPLNLACSGIPTRASRDDWIRLAGGDARLERALGRLHELFREADTLGSLIDPRRAVEDGTLESVPFEEVEPLLERALAGDKDPVAAVFNDGAREVARAAEMLAQAYALVATNVPYLARGRQSATLTEFCDRFCPEARNDLATAVVARSSRLARESHTSALVCPQNWLFLSAYRRYRRAYLHETVPKLLARLGPGAFEGVSGQVVNVVLLVAQNSPGANDAQFVETSVYGVPSPGGKSAALTTAPCIRGHVQGILKDADLRIRATQGTSGITLGAYAKAYAGIQTGDLPRFVRMFWEQPISDVWQRYQGTVTDTAEFGGCEKVIFWEDGRGRLHEFVAARLGEGGIGAWIRGVHCRGKRGVAVSQMGELPAALYSGELYDLNTAVILPDDPSHHLAIWAFCSSTDYAPAVRAIDTALKVTNATLVKVPFDLEYWVKVAEKRYPNGLPKPTSDDPTQWLFRGVVGGSEQPLHVALARLLGYRWPDQEPDELDALADADGIVCLPAVAGERAAHERLRTLLELAYGEDLAQGTIDNLLAPEGSATLEDWLREKAFVSHAKLFHSRPYIWHIWDGRKDGFSALVSYHRLDHQTLEKLAFTYLNWWIERQKVDTGNDVAGAESRLAAAQELQRKLKLILEGEPPYDIYVRWKPLAEQPLGWEPDLNDGVRLNIRPFVTAGVLRAKPAIHWKKDRGKNPDGSERINDLHFTLAEKRAAREEVARGG